MFSCCLSSFSFWKGNGDVATVFNGPFEGGVLSVMMEQVCIRMSAVLCFLMGVDVEGPATLLRSNSLSATLLQSNSMSVTLLQSTSLFDTLPQSNSLSATLLVLQSNSLSATLLQLNSMSVTLPQSNSLSATLLQLNSLFATLSKSKSVTLQQLSNSVSATLSRLLPDIVNLLGAPILSFFGWTPLHCVSKWLHAVHWVADTSGLNLAHTCFVQCWLPRGHLLFLCHS